MLTKHVGDGQYHISGGDAFRNGTGQLETNDTRHQHGNRLAKHGRFGLNAANAPAKYAQTIDGGGVRVGTHAGIKIGKSLAAVFFNLGHDDLGEIFDIDLVDDARSGGTTRKFLNAC